MTTGHAWTGVDPPVPLSIVIGVCRDDGTLAQCLEALYAPALGAGAEIIVSGNPDDDAFARIRRRFGSVQFLRARAPGTIHQLRGLGIARCRGEIIAILDTYSIVDSGWVRAILEAHRERSNLAIGGVVELDEPASQSLAAWTMYIHEYANFIPPRRAGEADILAASNVSYKRAALFEATGQPKSTVFWKELVNREMKAAGNPLWLDPNIVVRLRKPIRLGDFLRTRFDNGRCFAGMRSADFAIAKRLVYAAGSSALPAVLLWRCYRAYSRSRRPLSRFLSTLPFQAALVTCWAAGEFQGYLCGPGGSCETLYY
jgi:hypothetical protein